MSNPTTIQKLHDFLDAAAGEGFIFDEIDAGDLFMAIFDDEGKINARFAGEVGGSSELLKAAEEIIEHGHQHDVGGGDVFISTCDAAERLECAVAFAVEGAQ